MQKAGRSVPGQKDLLIQALGPKHWHWPKTTVFFDPPSGPWHPVQLSSLPGVKDNSIETVLGSLPDSGCQRT